MLWDEVWRGATWFLLGYLAHKWKPHKRREDSWKPLNVVQKRHLL